MATMVEAIGAGIADAIGIHGGAGGIMLAIIMGYMYCGLKSESAVPIVDIAANHTIVFKRMTPEWGILYANHTLFMVGVETGLKLMEKSVLGGPININNRFNMEFLYLNESAIIITNTIGLYVWDLQFNTIEQIDTDGVIIQTPPVLLDSNRLLWLQQSHEPDSCLFDLPTTTCIPGYLQFNDARIVPLVNQSVFAPLSRAYTRPTLIWNNLSVVGSFIICLSTDMCDDHRIMVWAIDGTHLYDLRINRAALLKTLGDRVFTSDGRFVMCYDLEREAASFIMPSSNRWHSTIFDIAMLADKTIAVMYKSNSQAGATAYDVVVYDPDTREVLYEKSLNRNPADMYIRMGGLTATESGFSWLEFSHEVTMRFIK